MFSLILPGRVRPDDGSDCPICYDSTHLAVETNCGHIFCAGCVFQFYETMHTVGKRAKE
jgi:Zn ribbon nucleic-acid-binding protein